MPDVIICNSFDGQLLYLNGRGYINLSDFSQCADELQKSISAELYRQENSGLFHTMPISDSLLENIISLSEVSHIKNKSIQTQIEKLKTELKDYFKKYRIETVHISNRGRWICK